MSFSVHLPDVRDRARAAFLGLALGDALGATVEFLTPSEIRASHGVHRELVGGGWLYLKPGRVTDDTEMSLCIAQAISEQGGWSLRAIADRFSAWLRGRPTDAGNTCRIGIRNYINQGTLQVQQSDWHAGNGAAMRMAPVALYTLGDPALLEQLATEQAHVTHNHPLSDIACVLIGRLLHRAVLGCSLLRMREVADEVVARQPNFAFEPYRGGATGYVVDTMQTVLHFFFATRSFEECLVGVVNQGGDADTNGAIAGALAGAYYGLEELPSRWLKKLDPKIRAQIEPLTERLIALSPVGRGLEPQI